MVTSSSVGPMPPAVSTTSTMADSARTAEATSLEAWYAGAWEPSGRCSALRGKPIQTHDTAWQPGSCRVALNVTLDACIVPDGSGAARVDTAHLVVLDDFIGEAERAELLEAITEPGWSPLIGPPPSKWERATRDRADAAPTWGLRAACLRRLAASALPAKLEVHARLARLYPGYLIAHMPSDAIQGPAPGVRLQGELSGEQEGQQQHRQQQQQRQQPEEQQQQPEQQQQRQPEAGLRGAGEPAAGTCTPGGCEAGACALGGTDSGSCRTGGCAQACSGGRGTAPLAGSGRGDAAPQLGSSSSGGRTEQQAGNRNSSGDGGNLQPGSGGGGRVVEQGGNSGARPQGAQGQGSAVVGDEDEEAGPSGEAVAEESEAGEEVAQDGCEAPSAAIVDCNQFVANAPVHGDTYGWHVDADPSTLPYPSPWTSMYGQYVNREPGRPLFVSLLLYLNRTWEREWDAETLFLDTPSDCGVVVRPRAYRAVLMDQDVLHRLSVPSLAAGGRPRYSLVWKLVFVPRLPTQRVSLARPEWGKPTPFGSAAVLERLALLAAAKGSRLLDLERLLSDPAANPNVQGPEDSKTALHWACVHGRKEAVDALLQAGADLAAKEMDGYTALHTASSHGRKEVVEVLLRAGAEIAAKTNDGKTALHVAGTKAVVEALLQAGSDVAAKTDNSKTALHFAPTKEVVEALLLAGVDGAARTDDGWTALHWASLGGRAEAAEALLRAGADVESKANDGATALHCAKTKEVVEALLQAGADVAAKTDGGKTALHVARTKEVVEALLRAGADVAAKANDGDSVLHCASTKEVAEALLRAGADVAAQNNIGWTALHCASKTGNTEVVEALLRAGADIAAKDDAGSTPLDDAKSAGKAEVVALLEGWGHK
ncbi:Ankyrin repeat domain-containing protein [Tetrabaena socialis]|uniref:Ankyrin repeat domain-containing protein n=1 Tax=Tetrabaena socialis TaxID=47790 RepID=A0A2J8AF59_9CHLO|nr:Ankyrin repeat domain-containing protein [Tetrabaena socialis]|eukprot:PNH11163.1 Ankyrin repeat domain-containing protein [Tetrabaena socialis]